MISYSNHCISKVILRMITVLFLFFLKAKVQISFHITEHQDHFDHKSNFITKVDSIY